MALFAAGIVAIYQLYSGALRLAAGSRDASESSIYARQRMEEALLVPTPSMEWSVESSGTGTGGWSRRRSHPRRGRCRTTKSASRVTVSWSDGEDERAVDLSATRWRQREGSGGA